LHYNVDDILAIVEKIRSGCFYHVLSRCPLLKLNVVVVVDDRRRRRRNLRTVWNISYGARYEAWWPWPMLTLWPQPLTLSLWIFITYSASCTQYFLPSKVWSSCGLSFVRYNTRWCLNITRPYDLVFNLSISNTLRYLLKIYFLSLIFNLLHFFVPELRASTGQTDRSKKKTTIHNAAYCWEGRIKRKLRHLYTVSQCSNDQMHIAVTTTYHNQCYPNHIISSTSFE